MKINKLFFLVLLCLVIAPLSLKAEEYPFQGVIIGDALNIYDTAGGSNNITQLSYGTRVTVVEKSGSRYKIKYPTGEGYASASYVINYNDSIKTVDEPGNISYEQYCNELVQNGFDTSYCPYLYYLHIKHPQWIFRADRVNITMEEASKNESGRCVLQTSNTNYYSSDTPIEGSYYYVKQGVVASFMDPRNSLFEKTIFQFLDNADSKDICSIDALQKMASSGFISNYYNEFLQAGINNGINPLHIFGRSIQEGVNTPYNGMPYSAVSGLFTTTFGKTSKQGYSLDNYYNFYNIGAWKDNDYSTVQRGLVYAAGYFADSSCIVNGKYDSNICGTLSYQRPWDTPAKAISGGAEFIKTEYVDVGQDTKYYEKFNISSYRGNNMFSHQYMTNLYAPAGESIKMYNAYKNSNLLESGFIFYIPVFNDMKSSSYQAIDYSDNASLSAITINDRGISNFDGDVLEYTYYAPTNDNTINVNAASNNGSTISGIGSYTFENDEVVATITSVSQDQSNIKVYKVTVKKISPENYVEVSSIVDKMAVKITDDVMYGIHPNTYTSTIINSVIAQGGTAEIYDQSGNKINDNIPLATGYKIKINGTVESQIFGIVVRGDVTGDGIVNIRDLILLQSDIIDKFKLSGLEKIAANVNYDDKLNIQDLVLIQSHILEKEGL